MIIKFTNLIFILFTGVVFSQISVKSFKELTMDSEARFSQKETEDGDKCALIKVVTPYKDFKFDVGHAWVCGVDETQTGEIWLWVNEDAKYLTIRHPRLGILRRYRIPKKIEPLTTYELVLQTARITQFVEETVYTQWVVIDSKPSGAKVFINGNDTGKITPYQAELMLGKHYYKLEKGGYETHSGSFLLKKDNKKEFMIRLLSNLIDVTFKADPHISANIKISGHLQNQKTPFTKKLNQGTYIVEMKHPQYYSIKKAVVVKSDTREIVFKMRPKKGSLKIITEPYGAEIFIDGKSYGTTPENIKNILVGNVNVRLVKRGYDDFEKTISIRENQSIVKKIALNKKNNTSQNTNVYVSTMNNNYTKPNKKYHGIWGVKMGAEARGIVTNGIVSFFVMPKYFMLEFQFTLQEENKIDKLPQDIRDGVLNIQEKSLTNIVRNERNKSYYRDVRTVSEWQMNLSGRIPFKKNAFLLCGMGLGSYKVSYKYTSLTVNKEKTFKNFKSEIFLGLHYSLGRYLFLEGKIATIPFRTYIKGVNNGSRWEEDFDVVGGEGFFSLSAQVGVGIKLF